MLGPPARGAYFPGEHWAQVPSRTGPPKVTPALMEQWPPRALIRVRPECDRGIEGRGPEA